MMNLRLTDFRKRPLQILCLGAHSDDIEIGCGGTILHLIQSQPSTHVDWVVFSTSTPRRRGALRRAGLLLRGTRSGTFTVRSFPLGLFPFLLVNNEQDSQRLNLRFTRAL